MGSPADYQQIREALNESPSEKEGKYADGNQQAKNEFSLNESPSEKEGKFLQLHDGACLELCGALNESPSEKEGKFRFTGLFLPGHTPSMKVPPKRKGNESSKSS